MGIHVEIPDPLAAKVEDAAKSHSTSAEQYIIDAVSQKIADDATRQPTALNGAPNNPLLGLLSDDPDLADFLCQNAYEMRATLPMRAPRE